MALIRGNHTFDDQFTQIPNSYLRDSRLSLGAIGLLSQLLSHKPGWEITQENLARANNVGRDAIRTLVNQLVEAGYLIRSEKRQRNSAGHLIGYDYITRDPVLDEPTLAQPTLAEPTLDNPAHKKTIEKNTITKKTIVKRAHPMPDDWKPKQPVYDDIRYIGIDIDREAEKLRNWSLANGKLYKDWDAAFRNWLDKAVDFRASKDYKQLEKERQMRELDAWVAEKMREEGNAN